ncbi:uncharacterized protein MELLADRAFT_66015 [Melampsora larici-populina 98AG31]|uniref:Uncharacterized protein n=1 Tax=Melampsora larici-populina (strain 98AG31 / pathotype 3-4-7) TaxID=747676 RepID=F4RXK2_MELLP|nr:uncharacterized protein MELLADRAFT_66015 [Melampsora larici-populina 98AG31]EGG02878.1 hypothetical protein MELLADRAFT_66015 [Melampsora larici-populina 98AG31]
MESASALNHNGVSESEWTMKQRLLELFNFIITEFNQPTVGGTIIEYPTGRIQEVHKFGNNVFRIEGHPALNARCIYTSFEYVGDWMPGDRPMGILTVKHTDRVGFEKDVNYRITIFRGNESHSKCNNGIDGSSYKGEYGV